MTTAASNDTNKPSVAIKTLLLAVFACTIGIGSWIAIGKVTGAEAWDHRYYWMLGYPLLIATSFITAYVDHQKPWLWGTLPVLAQAVYVLQGIKYQAVVLPLTMVLYVALVIPCVVGAYLGIRLRRYRRHQRRS